MTVLLKLFRRNKPNRKADKLAAAIKEFHETVWKITASLILMKPSNDEKLIFHLTRAPLKLFSAATMKVIVECWNWLLSARPDIEMKFLQEMIFAWHGSQTSGLGLFCADRDARSPLAPDEAMKGTMAPAEMEIEPHDTWIRFIQERIEVAKYCSQEQVVMFTHMLQRTLDITVGREVPVMSRHVAAAGTRFRLLSCGMSLLQGDVLPKSVAKNILRQRVYAAALDYFCDERACPTQTGAALTEDIHVMLKFWATMHQDRKYIKTSAIGNLEAIDPSLKAAAIPPAAIADAQSVASEYPAGVQANQSWMVANPAAGSRPDSTSISAGNTLGKRSASYRMQGQLQQRSATPAAPTADSFVRDYTKKRWLILALLSAEIEGMVVYENPLETREGLVNLLQNRLFGSGAATAAQGNVGKQFDDAMKFVEEVRARNVEKSWREHARNAWDVAPALAVFLPQRLNSSTVLEKEVSRLVRINPEQVWSLHCTVQCPIIALHF